MNSEICKITEAQLTDSQIALWYLGQEGFIMKSGNTYLATDLYLSDYVDQHCCQFVDWKRLYPAPVAAEALTFLNVILCTHTHYDHADPWTLPKLAAANPTARFVVPAPAVDTVASYGIPKDRIIAAVADQPIEIDGFTVTPVPSAHEELHTDENGNYCELGYLIDAGELRVFHAGDMCMYDGLIERLKNVDVALLPINGRDYFRNKNDIIGNFNCEEAVTLAKEINAGLLVPLHHDLYEVNRVSPASFVTTLMALNPTQPYHIFAPGERIVYMK
ncbi:MAG: MBL fold metallo-hydrolase [Ruminococcaceae bacterium]|nr:MBL fold metallo-hydrolase [Oscillospiraceae bacterium]